MSVLLKFRQIVVFMFAFAQFINEAHEEISTILAFEKVIILYQEWLSTVPVLIYGETY